jgi:hypothetical protein
MTSSAARSPAAGADSAGSAAGSAGGGSATAISAAVSPPAGPAIRSSAAPSPAAGADPAGFDAVSAGAGSNSAASDAVSPSDVAESVPPPRLFNSAESLGSGGSCCGRAVKRSATRRPGEPGCSSRTVFSRRRTGFGSPAPGGALAAEGGALFRSGSMAGIGRDWDAFGGGSRSSIETGEFTHVRYMDQTRADEPTRRTSSTRLPTPLIQNRLNGTLPRAPAAHPLHARPVRPSFLAARDKPAECLAETCGAPESGHRIPRHTLRSG